jgi:hypothetical protein
MALQKVSLFGVAAFFQDLDILTYAFAPEKDTAPCRPNFLLSHHNLTSN